MRSLFVRGVLSFVLMMATSAAWVAETVYLEMRPLRVTTQSAERVWDLTPVLAFSQINDARGACANAAKLGEAFVRAAVRPVAEMPDGAPNTESLTTALKKEATSVLGALAPSSVYLATGILRDADFLDALLPFPKPHRCAALLDLTTTH